MAKTAQTGKRTEVNVVRFFEAPRDLVWKALTEPKRLKQWFGPKQFTTPVYRLHLKVGGEYLSAMQGPDGKRYWSKGVFQEIKAPERLVMTDSFSDENGNTVAASFYGMSPDWPREMLVTITLEDLDGKTRLTLAHGGAEGMTETERRNMEQGWSESFDKLAVRLAAWTAEALRTTKTRVIAEPGKQELFILRDFDAPRETIFKAFTDPELIGRWLGPRRLSMRVQKYESKSGGSWRFVHIDKDGKEYGFHGVNHEVLPPSRLIRTFEFEGLPETGHVSLETARFEELPGGGTRLTIQSVFQSVADRDGMISSGMEQGLVESHERLAELLRDMQPKRERVVRRRKSDAGIEFGDDRFDAAKGNGRLLRESAWKTRRLE